MKIPDDTPNSEIIRLINEYVRIKRDRCILKDRLVNGMCFEPLAEKFDLSVRQTKNIVYRNEKKIFRHCK